MELFINNANIKEQMFAQILSELPTTDHPLKEFNLTICVSKGENILFAGCLNMGCPDTLSNIF